MTTTSLIEQWRSKCVDSIAEFAQMVPNVKDVDFTYGILATAVLWPVRDLILESDGDVIDAIYQIAGTGARHVLKAARRLDADPLEAARRLAWMADDNPELQSALAALNARLDAARIFAQELNLLHNQELGQGVTIDQIQAALVNVGGIVNIQSLNVQMAQAAEIPPPPPPPQPPELVNFVGREEELQYYRDKLMNHHLAVICGMAGVGKTSLAVALAHTQRPSTKIFWHAFHEGEGFETTIWQLAGFLAWHGQEDLWHMLQRARQVGGQPPPPETLVNYLLQALQQNDYLLCFDDFQFVDSDPLFNQLVERLRTVIAAGELDVIVTSRQIPSFVQTIDFSPLQGLSIQNTQQLLITQGLDLTSDLVESLHSQTGGNAQFLNLSIDVLKQTKAPGRIIERLVETDDIERYLLQEVDKSLNEEERRLMTAVAVLLRYPATRHAIEALLDGAAITRTLRNLTDRHLLAVQTGEWGREYSQHAIVQTFYYEMCGQLQRQNLHRRAGVYYEQEEPDLLKAARHYQIAGAPDQAARLATQDVWAIINQGQARSLHNLLSRFDQSQLDFRQWAEVNLALGQVCGLLGDRQEAHDGYERALAALKALPDSPVTTLLRARVYQGVGELYELENPQAAFEWLTQGLEILGEEGENERASLLVHLGFVQIYLDDYEAAAQTLEQGLALLAEKPSPLRGAALKNLATVYYYTGQEQKAIKTAETALKVSEQLHDHLQMAELLSNLGMYQETIGEWQKAAQNYQKAVEIAAPLGSISLSAGIGLTLGAFYMKTGEDQAAFANLHDALKFARQNDLAVIEMFAQRHLAELYIHQQDWGAAKAHLQEAERLAHAIGAETALPPVFIAWAELNSGIGQTSQALECATRAVTQANAQADKYAEGIARRVLGQALAAEGRKEEALTAYEHSLQLLETQLDPYETARAQAHKGQLLLRHGQTEAGQALLQRAYKSFQSLGAKREQSRLEAVMKSET